MDETQETIAEIIAEMKRRRHDVWISEFRSYADRFDAAHRRERGDCAKLREALMEIRDICLRVGVNISPTSKKYQSRECQAIFACFRKAADALDVSPRNCDVGTAEEQRARHCAWCRKHGINGDNKVNCAHPDTSCDLCALRWAQMPYEEGGAK